MTQQVDFTAVPEVTLGWRIRMALDFGNLKHDDLMATFEVSRDTVSRWCRDVRPAPKRFVLEKIAELCGVSPKWLIEGVQTTAPPPVAAAAPTPIGRNRERRRRRTGTRSDRSNQTVAWIDRLAA